MTEKQPGPEIQKFFADENWGALIAYTALDDWEIPVRFFMKILNSKAPDWVKTTLAMKWMPESSSKKT